MSSSFFLFLPKLAILRFLTLSEIFSTESHVLRRFIIALIAYADPHSEVSSMGEDIMKRLKQPDWESIETVNTLYHLYQGSFNGTTIVGLNPNTIHQGSAAVRAKILHYLCKSSLATNQFPKQIQVIFDALYGKPIPFLSVI